MNNSKSPNNVRQVRRALDLTLQELGDLTDSSKSYIHDLENNRIRNPSLGKARLIAIHLKSNVDDIFPKDKS